jgi:hypothetical protein
MQVLPAIRATRWTAVLAAIVATTQTAGSGSAGEDFFTADVTISQMHVGGDGQRLPGAAPKAKYRIEQRPGPNALIRLTLVEIEGVTAESAAGPVSLDNAFLAVRMDLDPKGGLRLYNRRGERLREVTAADRRLFGHANPPRGTTPPDARVMTVRAQTSNLLVTAGGSGERRTNLERRFGKPVERVRGLDRYVAARKGDIDEVLVDPATALPVELNTVRKGTLASRVQMTHEPKGNGTFVRRWFRAERALPDAARRVVTTIDVSNVQVIAGGGQ